MDINQAAEVLKNGGIISYPTEAVWGLGCDPWNRDAVYKILQLKKRPVEKGVILIGSSTEQFTPLLNSLSSEEKSRLNATWPGPYTWLIPDLEGWVPEWVRGQFNTVAVRVSAHPVVKALCDAAGMPIISTSANLAGHEPLLTQAGVEEEFGLLLQGVVSGKTGEQKAPSIIQDLRTGQLVRAG